MVSTGTSISEQTVLNNQSAEGAGGLGIIRGNEV